MANANDDWEPPSEGELKILEARRERQDKISKLMGQYLLKGYKMLNAVCPVCQTVLLKTRASAESVAVEYCVACQEMDSDVSKDDPVLDLVAARSQAMERQNKPPSTSSIIDSGSAPQGQMQAATTSPIHHELPIITNDTSFSPNVTQASCSQPQHPQETLPSHVIHNHYNNCHIHQPSPSEPQTCIDPKENLPNRVIHNHYNNCHIHQPSPSKPKTSYSGEKEKRNILRIIDSIDNNVNSIPRPSDLSNLKSYLEFAKALKSLCDLRREFASMIQE